VNNLANLLNLLNKKINKVYLLATKFNANYE